MHKTSSTTGQQPELSSVQLIPPLITCQFKINTSQFQKTWSVWRGHVSLKQWPQRTIQIQAAAVQAYMLHENPLICEIKGFSLKTEPDTICRWRLHSVHGYVLPSSGRKRCVSSNSNTRQRFKIICFNSCQQSILPLLTTSRESTLKPRIVTRLNYTNWTKWLTDPGEI